jgi:ABC-2 type transport system ATP-binding protein
MDEAIVAAGLGRRFGRLDALREITLSIPAGQAVGVIGANGAGKSTLLRVLVNLLRPTAGHARVLGVDTLQLGPSQFARIGYLAADQRLPDVPTVEDLTSSCRPLYSSWDDAYLERLRALLDIDGAQPLASASRGVRLKVQLVVTLAFRPRLLLLDEPLEGLDPLTRDQVVDALLDLMTEQQTSVVLASHDLDVLERLLDRVVFLEHGRLLFDDTVDDLHRRCRRIVVDLPPHTDQTTLSDIPQQLGVVATAHSDRRVELVTTAYRDGETERALTAVWPGAQATAQPLSLRELFVAHARHAMVPRAHPGDHP